MTINWILSVYSTSSLIQHVNNIIFEPEVMWQMGSRLLLSVHRNDRIYILTFYTWSPWEKSTATALTTAKPWPWRVYEQSGNTLKMLFKIILNLINWQGQQSRDLHAGTSGIWCKPGGGERVFSSECSPCHHRPQVPFIYTMILVLV